MSEANRGIRDLASIQGGDLRSAEQLLPIVYDELRRLAAAKMAMEPQNQTLQGTALVHEAWLRLSAQRNQHYQSPQAFFGAAAEVMRRILVDRARRRRAARHGGGYERVNLESVDVATNDDELVQRVHEVLDGLEKLDPEKAVIVKLRFFVGLSFQEIAALLDVNERTVRRHWAFAKAWMHKELSVQGSPRVFIEGDVMSKAV